MKLYFLGTSGWFDTRLGNTLSVLLETDKAYIVFDAGGGFYKLGQYIKSDKPVILLLSHFHLDHIIGLHALNKFNFKQGLQIFGPPGVVRVFNQIINYPYSMPVKRLKIKVTIKEFKNNLKLPVDIKFARLLHTGVCYGYRISAEGKAVVFCTDTGVCRNLKQLAKGADVFITESSLAPGQVDKHWPHLNPQQAARIAKEVEVKKLILAHFDSGVYLTNEDRILAQAAAKKIFKNTQAAQDGLVTKV